MLAASLLLYNISPCHLLPSLSILCGHYLQYYVQYMIKIFQTPQEIKLIFIYSKMFCYNFRKHQLCYICIITCN